MMRACYRSRKSAEGCTDRLEAWLKMAEGSQRDWDSPRPVLLSAAQHSGGSDVRSGGTAVRPARA